MKHRVPRMIATVISALVVLTALTPSASCSSRRDLDDTLSGKESPFTEIGGDTSGYDEYVYSEYEISCSDDGYNAEVTQFHKKEANHTRKHYSESGKLEWSVTLSSTFYYDYKTSDCGSASVSFSIPEKNWSIVSSSATRSGNTATGKFTLKKTYLGVPMFEYVTLTMTCDKNGNITRN